MPATPQGVPIFHFSLLAIFSFPLGQHRITSCRPFAAAIPTAFSPF
jgi:hypothetical protein